MDFEKALVWMDCYYSIRGLCEYSDSPNGAPATYLVALRIPRGAVSVHEAEKHVHRFGVKVRPGLRPDMLTHFLFRPTLAVRTVGAQRIPDVCDREEARGQWDLISLQSLGIPGAIPFLVMVVRNFQCALQKGNRLEQVVSIDRMLAHHLPL